MDSTAFVKALLINAAATNAAAVCENTSGGGVPIDPLIQDAGLQGKAIMVYEEAKIQYAALLRAFQDKTGIWPDPKVSDTPVGLALPNLADIASQALPVISKLAPVLSTIPNVGPILAALTSVLGVTPPKQPLAPGQEIPPSPAPDHVPLAPPK